MRIQTVSAKINLGRGITPKDTDRLRRFRDRLRYGDITECCG